MNLTDLPPEILRHILEYLIPTKKRFAIERNTSTQNLGQAKVLKTTHRLPNTIQECALINHRISKTALDIIYGSNTFVFNDPWMIETFMVHIGRLNLQTIAHVELQAGTLTKAHNSTTTNSVFSIVSSNFTGLQTLRVIGVGRGKLAGCKFDPDIWLPSHLQRLKFIVSLPGVLSNAKVYSDREEHNARLLCQGAEYKRDRDEIEIDMLRAEEELKASEKAARKLNGKRSVGDGELFESVTDNSSSMQPDRKRRKVKPKYAWKPN